MRTICWTAGMSRIRPGPFTIQKRPSWNTTPRSYSRRMRSDHTSKAATRTSTPKPKLSTMIQPLWKALIEGVSLAELRPDWGTSRITRSSSRISLAGLRNDVQHQAVHRRDTHALTGPQRHRGAHAPGFAMHARPALLFEIFQHFALGADQLLAPAHHRTAARFERHRYHQ